MLNEPMDCTEVTEAISINQDVERKAAGAHPPDGNAAGECALPTAAQQSPSRHHHDSAGPASNEDTHYHRFAVADLHGEVAKVTIEKKEGGVTGL